MSYSAMISFKTINSDEVYPFFQQLKEETVKHFPEIAKENFSYSPYCRNNAYFKEEFKDKSSEYSTKLLFETADWAAKIFSYRYFYLPEHKLLGIFGLPNSLHNLFDNTTYFQNSCDQNYSFSEWKGVPVFENIAKECESMTESKILESDADCEDFDYFRESLAYDRIWSMFSNYLYNDKQVIYVTLFGHYERSTLCNFSGLVRKEYIEFEEEFDKELAAKQQEKKEINSKEEESKNA